MSRGGRRKGAGRPTDKPNREKFQYKLDPEIAKDFALWCRALRVPLNTTLESLMKRWTLDHVEDMRLRNNEMESFSGEELLRWYKAHPTRSANLSQLASAKVLREAERKISREAEQEHEEKMDRLRGLAASACIFVFKKKGLKPEQITAAGIRDLLGIADRCTVAEMEEALAQLRASGDLEQIQRELPRKQPKRSKKEGKVQPAPHPENAQ
jgi:hypothetical protein